MQKIIIAALAAAALSACNGGSYQLAANEKQTAELGARQFFDAMGAKYASCSGQDSDGDKYVTCTGSDAGGKPLETLCSFQSAGCKLK